MAGALRGAVDAARTSLGPELDVRYGPNPKQTLDLFLPRAGQ